ncbi:MAG TPA: non-homologous end-joining DNA ligase [Candidatus Dormibacteraeota bacterium]|jgi:DNA ligase D-like protein (predicted ligase)|nr:non-homologous end-joining DNA ligase [Candidatus Dormibacteraeota bacterium]
MLTDQLALGVDDLPTAIRPMWAVPAVAPFSSPDYLFEVKWEGLRCLLFVDRTGRVQLQDRALRDLTAVAPELWRAGAQVPPGTVLDGELVATDAQGRPDRQALRRRLAGGPSLLRAVPLTYLAFDLLYLQGRPLLRQPLQRRRERLLRAVTTAGSLAVPPHIEEDGLELFDACLERGLEGVVAKHRDSIYVPGQRSPFWLKVEAVRRDDFVVVGATPGGPDQPFGALLVACYEDGHLQPCGSVAGGFDEESAAEVTRRLAELEVPSSPLRPPPAVTTPVRWCRPELVVGIRYSEWSPEGTLRFPIFDGLRPEVHPSECVRARPRMVISGRARRTRAGLDPARFPF